jgi:hypothetical protein
MSEDAVQQLLDIEAIKQLKARYFRFMDTKQWDKWRTLFTDDCRFESSRIWEDVDEWVRDVGGNLQELTTVHHGHMPEIRLTGADTARGLWAMFDYLTWDPEQQPERHPGGIGLVGYGHYEETYRKVDGEWKISFLRLTRLRADAVTGDVPTPSTTSWQPRSADWLSSGA